MHIEKHYFWDGKAQMEEEMLLDAQLTDEERAAKFQRERNEFLQMLVAYATLKGEQVRVLNPAKVKAFQELSEGALQFAKQNQLNVRIDLTEEKNGEIVLEGDFFQVGDGVFPGDKPYLVSLIQTADQFTVTAKQESFSMEFWFPLCN